MTNTVIDPYGGFVEVWSTDVLNGASQQPSATLALPGKVIRPSPRINQITFPDADHYEICGFDCLVCGAYAVGLIDDPIAELHAVLADARFLKYNPGKGSDLPELARLAQRRGWNVINVPGRSGSIATQLEAQCMIGLTALNTHYGTGLQWNVLHPQTGGNVGHWECIGATTAAAPPEDDDAMTLDHARLHAMEWYTWRRPQQSEVDYWAVRLTKENPEAVRSDFLNSDEAKAHGTA